MLKIEFLPWKRFKVNEGRREIHSSDPNVKQCLKILAEWSACTSWACREGGAGRERGTVASEHPSNTRSILFLSLLNLLYSLFFLCR